MTQPHKVVGSTKVDLDALLARKTEWWLAFPFGPEGIVAFFEQLAAEHKWHGIFAVADTDELTAVENVEVALEGEGFALYRVENLRRLSAMAVSPFQLWNQLKREIVAWSDGVDDREPCFLGVHIAPGNAQLVYDAQGRNNYLLTCTMAALRPVAVAAADG